MSATREKDMQAGYARAGNHWPAVCFADGCAHRDKQVVAYLRARAKLHDDLTIRASIESCADQIERGEHVK